MTAALRLAARRVLSAALRILLRSRSRPLPPLARGAATLVIAPHPDDAELGCGGVIAHRLATGARVTVAYITDGSGSHPNHPTLTPEALSRQRAAEARRALEILGVDPAEIFFLNARDGTLDRLAPADADGLVEKLAALLHRVAPAEIFLPWRHDGSSEHEAAFKLVALARRRAASSARLYEFPIWAAWRPPLLRGALRGAVRIWRHDAGDRFGLKCAAIAAHRSQLEPSPPWTTPVLPTGFVSFFQHRMEFFFEHSHG